LQIKTLATFLYFNGLSLRAISQVLDYLGFPVNYEAIRKWVHSIPRFISLFYLPSPRRIFVDETKIKKGRKFYRLWLAVSEKGKLTFSWLSTKANNLPST
jgi:transposase-like protein